MRFKYYLRGCGLGILLAAIILTVGFCRNDSGRMSDADVMRRASELGMIMPNDSQSQGQVNDTEPSGGDAADIGTDTETMANPVNSPDDGEEDSSEKDLKPQDSSEDRNSEPQDSEREHSSERNSEETDASGNTSEADNELDSEPEKIKIVVRRGEVCRELAEELYEKGLIPDAEEFRKYMQETGYDDMILVGEYELTAGMEYREIAEIITTKQE